MNYRGVFYLMARLLLGLGVALLVPGCFAMYLDETEAQAFFWAAGIVGVLGAVISRLCRKGLDARFGRNEAFMLVSATWAMAALVGTLPYVFIKGPGFLVDGLFESASGFTTTGATILDDVEGEPRALLLWRSLTQWLGGMGIIVLGIAVLPKLAIGGMQLLGAEAPGPIAEKLTPRIASTAKALWGIYALLTGLAMGTFVLLGMSPFDAFNHAMTAVATSGFSTRNASIGAYGSAIQIAVMVFMVLGGINFALHFNLLRGRPLKMLRDPELRFYLGLIAGAAVLLTADLMVQGHIEDPLTALRLGAFQATTIITTTGFATADFDAWPNFARVLLFLLIFVGGCAGSTAGSVKVVRIQIVFKILAVQIKRLLQPNAVLPVRLGRRAIPDEVVHQVSTFLLMFVVVFGTGGLLLGMMGLDPISAFAASAACLGNIGPGFAEVGPSSSYSQLPDASKLMLVVMMIIGRLELYTVLVALYLFRRMF